MKLPDNSGQWCRDSFDKQLSSFGFYIFSPFLFNLLLNVATLKITFFDILWLNVKTMIRLNCLIIHNWSSNLYANGSYICQNVSYVPSLILCALYYKVSLILSAILSVQAIFIYRLLRCHTIIHS